MIGSGGVGAPAGARWGNVEGMGILQVLGLQLVPGTYVLLGPIRSSPSSRWSGGGEGSLISGAPVGVRGWER